uniref:beta-1,4-glucuronyltransferase 1-like n=1 Tax=Styela clava TaxID=7725 RepID=UPI00193A5096|nr:beta-1,4-glucuronyltransferase 1-like [Styela clava]
MNKQLVRYLYFALLVILAIGAVHLFNNIISMKILQFIESLKMMDNRLLEYQGVLDNSGKNIIIENVKLADEPPMKHDVSIVTQLDGSRIKNVAKMSHRWKGPIQATVVIVSVNLWNMTMEVVENLRVCQNDIKRYVSWHILIMTNASETRTKFIYTSQEQKLRNTPKSVREETLCYWDLEHKMGKLARKMIHSGPKGTKRDHIAYYPQTVAMNVGLKALTTDFFLAIDSDVFPSHGARDGFNRMAEKLDLFNPAEMPPPYKKLQQWPSDVDIEESICARHKYLKNPPHDVYVLPTFEANKKLPYNVSSLKTAFMEKKARAFYSASSDIYARTDHKKWIELSDMDSNVECSYEIEYARNYEPFFIARRGVALFNETFIGHSQVDVHHVALLAAVGYKFKILKNAFLVHDGMKSLNPVTGQRRKEAWEMWATWEAYLDNLDKTYRQR